MIHYTQITVITKTDNIQKSTPMCQLRVLTLKFLMSFKRVLPISAGLSETPKHQPLSPAWSLFHSNKMKETIIKPGETCQTAGTSVHWWKKVLLAETKMVHRTAKADD